jgi:16S rRNA (adenine1518-N6/adenine1519-N6)-dimethyltransferase
VTSQAALLGARDIRALAARLQLRPTKHHGQNFVIDANTVRRIVALAGLASGDQVLEVGPGLGSLTLGLLPAAAGVTAIEIDPLLAAELPRTVDARAPTLADRLQVITGDALRITAIPGPPPTALVANLPYNVAVPVLLHLWPLMPTIARTLVMVQAEVADRLAADPGSRVYGVPSVKARWYGSVRRVGSVGRTVFWPAPNVDSGLVLVEHRPPPATTAGREEVFAVVDAAFAQRRKTLRAALAGWAGSPAVAGELLERAGIDPSRRGEQLDVDAFAALAEQRIALGSTS